MGPTSHSLQLIMQPLVKIETQYKVRLLSSQITLADSQRYLARRWFDYNCRAALFFAFTLTSFVYLTTRKSRKTCSTIECHLITVSWRSLYIGFIGGLIGYPLVVYRALASQRSHIACRCTAEALVYLLTQSAPQVTRKELVFFPTLFYHHFASIPGHLRLDPSCVHLILLRGP